MNLAAFIDHTNLKSDALKIDIQKLCNEAIKYQFASVCIHPSYVKMVSDFLGDSNVKTCTVVGFPLGQNTTKVKVLETKNAIENGAEEIDMVINISWLKNEQYDNLLKEINGIKEVCGNLILKVIVETSMLTKDELIIISEIVKESDADFIKTSTGFGSRGASLEDVEIMNKVLVGSKLIKASGGVKSKQIALDLINAGANRIGTSSGVEIIK